MKTLTKIGRIQTPTAEFRVEVPALIESILLHFLRLVSFHLLYHGLERQSQRLSKTEGEVGYEGGMFQ